MLKPSGLSALAGTLGATCVLAGFAVCNIARNKIRSKIDVFLYFRTTMASCIHHQLRRVKQHGIIFNSQPINFLLYVSSPPTTFTVTSESLVPAEDLKNAVLTKQSSAQHIALQLARRELRKDNN